jgi:hypothetical protein
VVRYMSALRAGGGSEHNNDGIVATSCYSVATVDYDLLLECLSVIVHVVNLLLLQLPSNISVFFSETIQNNQISSIHWQVPFSGCLT